MLVFLEAIPSIRWTQLQSQTKYEILYQGAMEIPLIRSGSRLLMGISPPKESLERVSFKKDFMRYTVYRIPFSLIIFSLLDLIPFIPLLLSPKDLVRQKHGEGEKTTRHLKTSDPI